MGVSRVWFGASRLGELVECIPRACVRSPSQLGADDLRPRREGAHRVMLHLAPPDLVAAEGEERVLVLAAEADAEDAGAVGHGEDDLGGAVIGGDLDADAGRDEQAPLQRVAHRFRAGVVVPIGDVVPEEALLVGERAVVGDLVAARPLRGALGHREQPSIRAIGQAGGMLQAGVDAGLLAVLDAPDAAVVVVAGDVEARRPAWRGCDSPGCPRTRARPCRRRRRRRSCRSATRPRRAAGHRRRRSGRSRPPPDRRRRSPRRRARCGGPGHSRGRTPRRRHCRPGPRVVEVGRDELPGFSGDEDFLRRGALGPAFTRSGQPRQR